jgi:hypothetical protein
VRALTLAAFSSRVKPSRIAYVVTRGGIPLFLLEAEGRWMDVSGIPVEIRSWKE